MSEQFWLSEKQVDSLAPYFPRSHGKARVDNRRVLSGIIHVQRNGLRWCDAPAIYGPHKTLYNRHVRWTRNGVFARIFAASAEAAGPPERIIIDSTHLKAHPHGSELAAERGGPRQIGRTQGGLNSKLHVVCDRYARPVVLLLSPGQMSDHKGAGLMIDVLPPARELVTDRGYDSHGFRAALEDFGITPCIPSRENRKHPIHTTPTSTDSVENLFAKLKDWRRIATQYDRCADIFMGAVTLPATVMRPCRSPRPRRSA